MHQSKYIVSFLLAACLFSGCKKWVDVNYNPLDITAENATPDLFLAGQLEGLIPDARFAAQWMGYWCHYRGPQGITIQTYYHAQVGDGGIYSATPPAEVSYLEEKARSIGAGFYQGIAKVMKVIHWSRVVDVVNNAPYKDAYNVKILQPRYDDGKSIYEDLMLQLDSAVTLIKGAVDAKNVKISIADIMFHGDKQKWVRLINTLKLRLLIHQANRTDRASYIDVEMAKIKAEGSGFLGSGEDAAVNPGYVLGKKLSWYFGHWSSDNIYGGGDQDALTQIISYQIAHANIVALNFLKADHDPRMGLLYDVVGSPLPAGAPEPFAQPDPQDYRGSQFGLFIDINQYPYQNMTNLSAVGGSKNAGLVSPTARGIIKGRDMSDWVVTSIESFFLQAEAIQRGWLPGDPEQAYLDAVKESFRWLNAGGNSTAPAMSDAVFQTWYDDEVTAGNTNVSWAAAPDKYKLLMYQKYMAFNGIEPLETWTDYRRNGRFPAIPASVDPGRTGNLVPLRLEYNQNEYIVNTANVNEQGKIDIFNDKIWWMP